MNEYLMIATVLKPQGVRGECKIRSYAADIDLFRGWHTLYVKKNETFTPVSVQVNRVRDGFVYAHVGECKTLEQAEQYRNIDLYVDRAHASPAEEGANLIADLIGCEARDEEGQCFGRLTEVLQYGPVDTWVFDNGGETLMAPALRAVFPDVDIEARTIRVNRERLEEVVVRP